MLVIIVVVIGGTGSAPAQVLRHRRMLLPRYPGIDVSACLAGVGE